MRLTVQGPGGPSLGTGPSAVRTSARTRLVASLVRHAAARPESIAVRDGASALTYPELLDRAAGVAERLRRHGGGAGGTVLLHLPHGSTTVVGIVAVLMAGGRYVVADPHTPPGRRREIAEAVTDAGDAVLLADPLLDNGWSAGLPLRAVLRMPSVAGGAARASDAVGAESSLVPVWREDDADSQDEAYVLFTSGSQGKPKGVRQSVPAVLAMARNQVDVLRLTHRDRVSLLTSFGYDMAGVDLWSTLLAGGTLVCVDLAELGAGATLARLASSGVTVVHAATTVWRLILSELARGAPAPESLRLVLIGGEPAQQEDVQRSRALLGPHLSVAHGYGASEVSFVSLAVVDPGEEPPPGQLSAGPPLPGVSLELVGTEGDGTGELLVTGSLVALGYLGESSDAFTQRSDGRRSYRTGDVGVVRPDGSLLVRGRVDRQIKVLGHRVEPEELEGVLGAVDGVRTCAVVPVASAQGTRLVTYCSPVDDADPTRLAERMRRTAAERFPVAVRPLATFVRPELPLTVSGKVDRLSLERSAAEDLAARDRSAAPGSVAGTTALVRAAFAHVLGQRAEAVPLDIAFFELGGQSLQLAPLCDRLRGSCPGAAGITVATILTRPTVAALAAHLETGTGHPRPAPDDATVQRAAAIARRARRARKRRG